MSIEDEIRAKGALTRYLTEWGVMNAPLMANKFITELVAQGWQMAPLHETRPRPPKVEEACRVCNRHLERCICEVVTQRPDDRSPPNSEWREARSRLAHLPAPSTEETP